MEAPEEMHTLMILKHSVIPRRKELYQFKIIIMSDIITSVTVTVTVIPYCNTYTRRNMHWQVEGGREGK